jgi:hypothetical protein
MTRPGERLVSDVCSKCGTPTIRAVKIPPGEPGHIPPEPGQMTVPYSKGPNLCDPCYSEVRKNWKPPKYEPPPPEEREDTMRP